MKRTTIAIIALIIIGALAYYFTPVGTIRKDRADLPLEDASYSWDDSLGACVRARELDQTLRNVARTALDYIGSREGTMTVTAIEPRSCEGCYYVTVESGGTSGYVELEAWRLKTYAFGDDHYPR